MLAGARPGVEVAAATALGLVVATGLLSLFRFGVMGSPRVFTAPVAAVALLRLWRWPPPKVAVWLMLAGALAQLLGLQLLLLLGIRVPGGVLLWGGLAIVVAAAAFPGSVRSRATRSSRAGRTQGSGSEQGMASRSALVGIARVTPGQEQRRLFRLERVEASGKQSFVSVKALAPSLYHAVREGDEIEVVGRWSMRGTYRARRIINRTTDVSVGVWLSSETKNALPLLALIALVVFVIISVQSAS